MCRRLSFAGSTLVLFNIADLRDGQSCSFAVSTGPEREPAEPGSRNLLSLTGVDWMTVAVYSVSVTGTGVAVEHFGAMMVILGRRTRAIRTKVEFPAGSSGFSTGELG
jgi:hypothetical protein